MYSVLINNILKLLYMACYTVSTRLLRQDQIFELFIFMRTKIINFLKFKIKSVNIFKKLNHVPDFLV